MRRVMMLIGVAAMVTAMFAASAAPAMANINSFNQPFLGCFNCGARNFANFNQPFLGCFDCDDDFFDGEHVGPLHREDGLLCARVREGFDRSLECVNPATGDVFEF